MSTPNFDEGFDLYFTPKDKPTSPALRRIAEIIREASQIAPADLTPPDPDAAPTTLADAVAQAEDEILGLAAAPPRPPVTTVRVGLWQRAWVALRRLFGRRAALPTADVVNSERQRDAEAKLRDVVAKLGRAGIVLTAEAMVAEPAAVASE